MTRAVALPLSKFFKTCYLYSDCFLKGFINMHYRRDRVESMRDYRTRPMSSNMVNRDDTDRSKGRVWVILGLLCIMLAAAIVAVSFWYVDNRRAQLKAQAPAANPTFVSNSMLKEPEQRIESNLL